MLPWVIGIAGFCLTVVLTVFNASSKWGKQAAEIANLRERVEDLEERAKTVEVKLPTVDKELSIAINEMKNHGKVSDRIEKSIERLHMDIGNLNSLVLRLIPGVSRPHQMPRVPHSTVDGEPVDSRG